jgi:hypothetical protein
LLVVNAGVGWRGWGGQLEYPAGSDEGGAAQSVSVWLATAAVEGVDLGPSVAVAEGAVGDAPQAVVDTGVGWLDADSPSASVR